MKISLLKAFIEVIEKYDQYTIRYFNLDSTVNKDTENIKYILHLLGYEYVNIDYKNHIIIEEYYSKVNNKYFTLEMIL